MPPVTFAPDPAVPQRDVLLDPARLGPRLVAILGLRGRTRITRVEPAHVRYRVGRGVGLVLRITTDVGSFLVSARSFEPGRARSNYERALQTALPAAPQVRPVGFAPELETVVWTFPNDRRIASLELLCAPSEDLAALVGQPCTPRIVAYVPEKAATASCVDWHGATVAYVKVYGPDEHDGGLNSFRLLGWLQREAGDRLRIPRALGYDRARCAVAVQAIAGASLDLQDAWTDPAHLAALGAALATLHCVTPPSWLRRFERLAPKRLIRAADLIGAVRPDLGGVAFELADRLGAAFEDDDAPAFLHGDVHAKNALWDGRAMALIDLDQAAVGPPAADLGSVLAGIRYLRCLGRLSHDRERALSGALLDGYGSVRTPPGPQTLVWHTAAALLGERAVRSVTRIRPAGLACLGEVLDSGLRALPLPRAGARSLRRPVGRKPPLVLYCQHAVGLGHLIRSLTLAGALAERFDVALLSGGIVPDLVTPPPGVDLVALAPLILKPGGGLLSPDPARGVQEARAARSRVLAEAVRARRPAVVLVELFPFGRRAFAAEILAMLEHARTLPGRRPLVASSVRDILVGRGGEQRTYDERVCRLANAHFDAILVHTDPRFARLEESFRPATPLRVPVHYTGFVSASRPAIAPGECAAPMVLVSAGGGRVGAPLLRAAIEAYPLLHNEHGMRMRVIAGPFLGEESWRELTARAKDLEGLDLVREVPDLSAELAQAAVSVSQCGYNTALEVLKSQVPALVVPYLAPGEDEQLRRARRLAELDALRMIDPRELTGARLATAVAGLRGRAVRPVDLDVGGAATSSDVLWNLLKEHLGRPEVALA